MKTKYLLFILFALFGGTVTYEYAAPEKYVLVLSKRSSPEFRDGDIIFQTTNSLQSKAIQMATRSPYSHCGIIFQEGNELYVYEAVQPVTRTRLKNWVARGDNDHYVVKRLKNAGDVLTAETVKKMKAQGEKYQGKDYDLFFEWNDSRMYCSELVWKIYNNVTGIKVGKLEKLKDFDLSNPLVQQQLKQRYGKDIPYDEQIISPASIYNSELLMTMYSN